MRTLHPPSFKRSSPSGRNTENPKGPEIPLPTTAELRGGQAEGQGVLVEFALTQPVLVGVWIRYQILVVSAMAVAV